MEYQMPIKAIKRILKDELNNRRDAFYNAYPQFIMTDTMKEMINFAYYHGLGKLEMCNTYDDLDGFLSWSGYRMSLQEWIDSL